MCGSSVSCRSSFVPASLSDLAPTILEHHGPNRRVVLAEVLLGELDGRRRLGDLVGNVPPLPGERKRLRRRPLEMAEQRRRVCRDGLGRGSGTLEEHKGVSGEGERNSRSDTG